MAQTDYPPYGRLNVGLLGAIAANPVPAGFPGTTADWKKIYDAIVDRIAAALWPRWRPPQGGNPGGWHGTAAAAMDALTEADFTLLKALRSELDQPVAQRLAHGAPLASWQTHRRFFSIEDDVQAPLPLLEYLPAAERLLLEPLPRRMLHWMDAHCTAFTLPSKLEIQRPRPYQMAMLQGRAFDYEHADTAVTAAMPSGHSIQGLVGACSTYIELTAQLKPDGPFKERLSQYAVDHGDRRVFAGVHYPSDNLASWAAALALCPALYGARSGEALDFMAVAITMHSKVYQAIQASALPAYAPALAWLNELIAVPVPPPAAAVPAAAMP